MNVLELTGFGGAERTGRNHTQSLGIGFGDLNGAVGIDLFQNGNMAVRAIGIGLAGANTTASPTWRGVLSTQ